MGDKEPPQPGTRRLYKFLNKPPRIAYALGLGPLVWGLVLLLTTTGRKTGLQRVTPLQYEQIEIDLVTTEINKKNAQRLPWHGFGFS